MTDDHELLAQYARTGSEAAFNALVARYVNLVHSAAMRFTSNPHHAEEITQAVFIILARKAGKLRRDVVLSGWLYQTARLTAANFVKGETRRQHREQEAYMQSTLNESPGADWKQIAPILDEAMGWLGKTDRNAVVLRFFENKTAQEVAAALKLNEAAAQKRITRALEKLRGIFAKRGVTLSTAALGGTIAANSVQAVPAGLAANISTAAIAGTTFTATSAIVMTTLQKTIVTAALAVAAGAGIYEAREASTLRTQVEALRQQQAPLTDQTQQLTRERDDATRQLAASRDEIERLKRNNAELLKLRGEVAQLRADSQRLSSLKPADPNDSTAAAAQAWLERVKLLRQRFDQSPGKKTPELQLLNEQDWLNEVANCELDSDEAIRESMSKLRLTAKGKFADTVKDAVELFVQSNNGQYPSAPSELKAYLKPPTDSILDGWEIAKPGSVRPPQPNSPNSKRAETWALVEKGTFIDGIPSRDGGGLSDPDYDMNVIIYRGGYFSYGPGKFSK